MLLCHLYSRQQCSTVHEQQLALDRLKAGQAAIRTALCYLHTLIRMGMWLFYTQQALSPTR